MVVDLSSFVVNLHQRRDASFYLFGEASQFVYRLCSRCFTPDTVPLESSWFHLMGFKTSEGKFKEVEDFLIRLKLSSKVAAASKIKAEGLLVGKKPDKATIQKTVNEVKSDFVQEALSFIKHVIEGVLHQVGLNSHLVQGLAAFNPQILFSRPIDVALRHFEVLYNTFLLRSWVTSADESYYREEYLGLIDHLRITYPADFNFTDLSADLIEFLMGVDFLRAKPRLLRLFKLCCLCITACSREFPPVTFGNIGLVGPHGRFTDVVLPGQSYLSGVPDSIPFCSQDSSLPKFSLLASDFGRAAFAPTYDPWDYVDTFGRSKIYKSLLSSYKVAAAGPQGNVVSLDPREVSPIPEQSALQIPSSTKRRRMGTTKSRSSSSSVTSVPTPSTSKK